MDKQTNTVCSVLHTHMYSYSTCTSRLDFLALNILETQNRLRYHIGLQIVKCNQESAEDEEVLEIGEF